ncbi:MAG TPA: phosphatidylglycerophosphatase A [Candidatus Dormibacteraeota bacterium]|nr:phosphatidylglycerophosphatase A [Candidatus Dormibacteraeota bacterium]
MATNAENQPSKPRLALALATVFGAGRLPLVPGTFGSLVGVGVGWLIARTMAGAAGGPLSRNFLITYFVVNVAVAAVGIWAASRAAAFLGRKDPQSVVIDEVSGQLIAYSGFLVGLATVNWKSLILGFILFRGFDVLKPSPARRAEWLPGGWGIMADDWIAGGYAAIALWLIHRLGF